MIIVAVFTEFTNSSLYNYVLFCAAMCFFVCGVLAQQQTFAEWLLSRNAPQQAIIISINIKRHFAYVEVVNKREGFKPQTSPNHV